jgi:hypothetical protein
MGLTESVREIAALDLTDDTIFKTVLVTANGNRFPLKRAEIYSGEQSTGEGLLKNSKPEALLAIVGEQDSSCFVLQDVNEQNIEMEKSGHGLTRDNFYSDYLSVYNNALLVAMQREAAEEAINNIKVIFPGVGKYVNTSWVVCHYYAYRRAYPAQGDLRAALVHCTSKWISVLVVQSDMQLPVWFGTMPVVAGDMEHNYNEICNMLKEADSKAGGTHYDLMLLSGECDYEDVRALLERNPANQIELFNPFRNNAFEMTMLSEREKTNIQKTAHRYVLALGAAGMYLEQVGVNFSDEPINLYKEIPVERAVNKNYTPVGAILEIAGKGISTAVPLIFSQTPILIAALLIMIGMFGWNFYTVEKDLLKISSDMSKEQKRAESLADIRARYDEYKNKITAINDRVNAVREIQQRQFTINTVVNEIDVRVPPGLIFGDVDIQGTGIKIKGTAPDRTAVASFSRRLGESMGKFADVTPVFDDKGNTGAYEISSRYIGPVPDNPRPLPATVAPQIQQGAKKE